ncbi:MAG TPA: ABC transporter permease [Candidatus Eisenbergiella merdipullorum]|uniref:ABC transporter permease n=1 Tax=Candidatus Eisenbergiella merdipullorum TaxID=2838553 RepID=A0A9D2L0H4_9FIRM|nr:ABC transporter permease [Candidatus Eisenbergiella merdipullorum]
MLSRLIRHEWKETWRIPAISCIVILALTLVCFICFRRMQPPADASAINAGAFVIMMLYCLLVSCIGIVMTIFIAIRFYRNLYTEEGYLMHTLPVTPRQLVVSKMLVAVLWMFVLSLLTLWAICCILLFGVPAMVNVDMTIVGQFLRQYFPQIFGMGPVAFLLFYVVLSLVSSFSGVLLVYAAISLGQLFSRHKVMASILCYIGFSMLIQTVTTLLMTPSLTRLVLTEDLVETTTGIPAYFGSYMREILLLSMAGSAICAVISYILTEYIMSRQLNLD